MTSEYVPDPCERGLANAERWETENHVGGGMYRCGCGKTFDIDVGETLSADPYAIPVCPDCFEPWKEEKQSGGEQK